MKSHASSDPIVPQQCSVMSIVDMDLHNVAWPNVDNLRAVQEKNPTGGRLQFKVRVVSIICEFGHMVRNFYKPNTHFTGRAPTDFPQKI